MVSPAEAVRVLVNARSMHLRSASLRAALLLQTAYDLSAVEVVRLRMSDLLALGERAQQIARDLLPRKRPDAFAISPRDTMADLRAQRRNARRSPLTPTQERRDVLAGIRAVRAPRVGDRYTAHSYRRAINRACYAALADVDPPAIDEPRTRQQAQEVA